MVVLLLRTPGRSQKSEERELSSQAQASLELVCNPNIFSPGQPQWDGGWGVLAISNVALFVLCPRRFAHPA